MFFELGFPSIDPWGDWDELLRLSDEDRREPRGPAEAPRPHATRDGGASGEEIGSPVLALDGR